jgi:[acyl-carrier-protein] S-malonyltransferase
MENNLKDRLVAGAVAFRGYNLTNLGRTPELLAHSVYGPTVERHLANVSALARKVTGKPIDLVERVRQKRESTIDTFCEDIGLIIGASLAQIEILKNVFGIEYSHARVALGYSLGEVTALVASGVYQLDDVLPTLFELADDCAEMADGVTMGILFSRGPTLDVDAVQRLCLQLTQEGKGVIGISSYLSPNTVLLLGQGDTLDRFKQRLADEFPGPVYLRKHQGSWPPLHTPLLWQRSIPNRAAVLMHTVNGGFKTPHPPVLSLVTGKLSYNAYNSRETLIRWLDHPQKLWDAVYELLAMGVEVVIHVGPDPNLMPATFKRLSDNVTSQVGNRAMSLLGTSAMRGIVSRPWLSKVLSARVALLRAPFVKQIILEDWLLEQTVVQPVAS